MTTTQQTEETQHQIKEHLKACFRGMPILNELCAGSLDRSELRRLALVHYAETRTFINIKNPARLYLCPHDAIHAKRYFCYLYKEEQGSFRPGKNHADLFKPACYDLGLTDTDLESSYEAYSEPWTRLFKEKPSYEVMVRELAISVAWESIMPHFAEQLMTPLRDHYNLSEQALYYFELHYKVDKAHSARATDTLTHYCDSEALLQIALRSIERSLNDDLHLLSFRE